MIRILLPMAGQGRRFVDCGYPMRKPLVPVHGVPLIELVVANLRISRPHRFIFLVLRDHLVRWNAGEVLRRMSPGATVIPVERVTEGAACTALLAREEIDGPDPLVIAN